MRALNFLLFVCLVLLLSLLPPSRCFLFPVSLICYFFNSAHLFIYLFLLFFLETVNFPKVAFVSSVLHGVLGFWGFVMHLKSSLDRSNINFLTLNPFLVHKSVTLVTFIEIPQLATPGRWKKQAAPLLLTKLVIARENLLTFR